MWGENVIYKSAAWASGSVNDQRYGMGKGRERGHAPFGEVEK
jgi:hypothetical protein